MKRVVIKGTSGAGKSTLGRDLARHLDVPFVELDALHHGPDWAAASADELRALVLGALDDERGWVVDGNYDSKLGSIVLERADLVVWLDLPLGTKLWRLARRSGQRWLHREVLWNGNRELPKSWFWGRDTLFPYAVLSHFRQRKQWPAQLAGRDVLRLRTPGEVAEWCAALGLNRSGSPPSDAEERR